mgnify:CR=1 FL=1
MITLAEALDSYLAARESLKPQTEYTYRLNVDRVLGDLLDVPLDQITRQQVVERHQEHSLTAPKTADYACRVLRAVSIWAAENHADAVLPVLPTSALSTSNLWNALRPTNEDTIGLENVRRWFWAVRELDREPRDLLFFLVLTRCRRDSVLTLRFDDVDFDRWQIHAKEGSVPASSWLIELLWFRQAGAKSDNVFEMKSPYKSIKSVVSRTGLAFTPSTLRATFDTLAIASGIEPEVLRAYQKRDDRHSPERFRILLQSVCDLLLSLAGVYEPRPWVSR